MQHVRPSVASVKKSVSADVEAYLAAGGQVTRIPTGPYPAPRKSKTVEEPPRLSRYTQNEVLNDKTRWRPVVGYPLYFINRAGEVWSLNKRRLLPVTVRSRKVRLSTGNGADSFVRLCVDDLVAEVFGND